MTRQKIRIKLKSYDHKVLDESLRLIVNAVLKTGSTISGPILLPVKIRKYTVLRSPHTDKKSRDQFEIRIYKRLIYIVDANSNTVESLMRLELSSGVEVEIKT